MSLMPADPTNRCVWGRLRYEFQAVPDLHESARYAYVCTCARRLMLHIGMACVCFHNAALNLRFS